MLRRVSWVRSWSSVSRSGSPISVSSRTYGGRDGPFGRLHPGLADGDVGLAPLEAGPRDGRRLPKCLGCTG